MTFSGIFYDLMLLPNGLYFCNQFCGKTVEVRGDMCQDCFLEEVVYWSKLPQYKKDEILESQTAFFGAGNEPCRKLMVCHSQQDT